MLYSKVLTKCDRKDLTDPDSTVKNTYSKYMDRILSTVGFKCAATSTDGKDDSYMSDMTAISNVCEQSDPLNGARKKIMHDHAMSILTSAELEAEVRFRAFLTSKNSAMPFLAPYLAEGSPIKTLLAKKFTQLRSILDLRCKGLMTAYLIQVHSLERALCIPPYTLHRACLCWHQHCLRSLSQHLSVHAQHASSHQQRTRW